MIGARYGRLTVSEYCECYISPKGRKLPKVTCICDCGEIKDILVNSLKTGHTTSCGCFLKESRHETRNATHGKSGTHEYSVWKSMRGRCLNTNDANYHHYGGRGIVVCDRWLESFENFLEDMGERPSEEHTIERVDVNCGYSPDNCKWVEFPLQARNRRKRFDNTSGKTGVFHHKKSISWDVIWMDGGVRKTKCFSVSKYGTEAYVMACSFRDATINNLNLEGAGYADGHGK